LCAPSASPPPLADRLWLSSLGGSLQRSCLARTTHPLLPLIPRALQPLQPLSWPTCGTLSGS